MRTSEAESGPSGVNVRHSWFTDTLVVLGILAFAYLMLAMQA